MSSRTRRNCDRGFASTTAHEPRWALVAALPALIAARVQRAVQSRCVPVRRGPFHAENQHVHGSIQTALSISFALKPAINGARRLERGDSAEAVTATPFAGSLAP